MADNVAITAGAGTTIATDDIGGVQYPRSKVSLGADGSATDWVGTAGRGGYVDPRLSVVRLSVTPTISTSAYSAAQSIGGLLTFSNAARASGGSCSVQSVQISDKVLSNNASIDLVFFDRTLTATDQSNFDPTDTDITHFTGQVSIVPADWVGFNDNSAVSKTSLNMEMVLNGTDLFGVMIARDANTWTTTSDLTVIVTVVQD